MPVQHLEQLTLVAVPYVHPAVWISNGQGRQEKALAKKKGTSENWSEHLYVCPVV
jgi:hypothetical protein